MSFGSRLGFSRPRQITRRDLFGAGLGVSLGVLGGTSQGATRWFSPLATKPNVDVYSSLGVRPIINCDHVKTILGGSLVLPEVLQAMERASHHFVQLDELMEGVGARLASLTGSEWCIVTSGCAAAIAHATSACIAGGDPERLRRLPDLTGLKNQVVIPRYSRNLYDQAVRMLGVQVVEVATIEELEAALNQRTAMIYVLGINDAGAGWLGDKIPDTGLGVKAIADRARARGIPLFVDAAAEDLTSPNVYLQRGATLVGYSGGKVLRGPQCSGLLMGRKDLVRAAWVHSAPHHSFGRPMKVGKEEIIGLLAAVELWFERDHASEWRQWESWLATIAEHVKRAPGVTTEITHGSDFTLHCPTLLVRWADEPAITGEAVKKLLEQGTPRIFVGESAGDWQQSGHNSLTIRPLTLQPGEERLVAVRLYEALAAPARKNEQPRTQTGDVSGSWKVYIEFVSGNAEHGFSLQQRGAEISGTHRGEVLIGELHGKTEGNEIRLQTAQKYQGNWLRYTFNGMVEGNKMHGSVDLGQYGHATWTAQRRTLRAR
jgi:uncharacterized pyridoxal phosphate-dependent enzyme